MLYKPDKHRPLLGNNMEYHKYFNTRLVAEAIAKKLPKNDREQDRALYELNRLKETPSRDLSKAQINRMKHLRIILGISTALFGSGCGIATNRGGTNFTGSFGWAAVETQEVHTVSSARVAKTPLICEWFPTRCEPDSPENKGS